jgi:arylsulfatase A-like enzyme
MCQHKAPHRNWAPGPDHLSKYEDTIFPEPPNLFDDYKNRATPARNQKLDIDRYMAGDLKVFPYPGGDDEDRQVKAYMSEYGRMNAEQERLWDAAYRRRTEEFQRLKPTGKDLVRWKYQQYMKDYLACIASVDDNVGRVLRFLETEGLADNTIVIYASDQGFFLGEHGWYDKRWIYEESLRTPFVLRWPGVTKPGTRSTALVSNVDFAETFVDAAGAPVPADMQGRSLVPLLRGQAPSGWRKSFYYHYYEDALYGIPRHYGLRTDRFTLVHYYDSDEWELFDLRKDPRQMRNVYADPAHARTVSALKAETTRLRKELKVPQKDSDRT